MNRVALIAGGVVVAAALAVYTRRSDGSADETAVIDDAAQGAAEFFDSITGGSLKLSAMANITPGTLSNGNVRAFLRVIRRGEGTADEGGYKRLFGGGTFASFTDHPRISVTKNGYTSTAAGAYQALISTWDETKRIMHLPDFSPASQDLFAVGRIAARGALDDVIAGRFSTAVAKVAKEWASMPGSPYGQPTISMSTAANVYADAGGTVA
jgi:muramidase (phage lysozyme)